jgi:hypothetical protein
MRMRLHASAADELGLRFALPPDPPAAGFAALGDELERVTRMV